MILKELEIKLFNKYLTLIFELSKLCWTITLFNLSGLNKSERVMSLAVEAALNGSKETPVFPLKDSLVLENPKALGGNNFNLSLGIARLLASKDFKTDFKALFCVSKFKP